MHQVHPINALGGHIAKFQIQELKVRSQDHMLYQQGLKCMHLHDTVKKNESCDYLQHIVGTCFKVQ